MSTKKLTRLSLFTTLALIMSLVESALPPLFWFAPGAKLGLANLLSLIALFTDGVIGGYIVLIIRILLASVFGGSFSTLIYALPAGVISYSMQVLLVKLCIKKIGVVSISVVGGVLHNVTQTVIASLITGVNLYSLIIYTLPTGFVAGLFVGVVAYFTLKHLPDKFYGN
ncbi:MAG: Gx transporter family protein [Clostridiales bacterium]|nr:Gx transporter family protein [Clostridiales bacterium]